MEDDADDGQPEPSRRLELLDVHEEAAVTADGDDLAVGVDELGRDGGR